MQIPKPAALLKKSSLNDLIDQEKIKKVIEWAEKLGNIAKTFFWNKENERSIVIIGSLLSITFLAYGIIQIVSQSSTLEQTTNNLDKVENYNLQTLQDNRDTKTISTTVANIGDLLDTNKNIKEEITRYQDHKKELQSSYSNFLQYFLVPKLNIRKEAYTDKINLDLIGGNFLDNNPFNDINLYQKWSNFFESTEKNQVNVIEDLEIGDITEADYGLYSIKLSFSFITPSKNALLFLADKISMTSDKENISLLGEFVYYLRQQIKADKKDEITKLKADVANKDLNGDEDKIIGKTLYNWVFKDIDTKLIDEKTINKAVKNVMECGSEQEEECFYKFRDKYRNIAELAYTIWSTTNTNKTDDLKLFLKNLPPLMAVQKFTFDKIDNPEILDSSIKYEGKVELQIYGQNISNDEMSEIWRELGKKCFGKNQELNTTVALNAINKSGITSNGDNSNANNPNIIELKTLLENQDKEKWQINNYKKTIRLFETYRMLNEGGFCTTI